MISGTVNKKPLSPQNYHQGFEEAIEEFDRFEQVKKRLNQIKAYQQLKKGQAFLDLIEAA